MIASITIGFSRIKVAIKVIRSAFSDEEAKQFNEVSGLFYQIWFSRSRA